MTTPKTKDLLDTYQAICLLAKVYRHNNVTFDAGRRENVAEHSYSLAVLASALAHDINQSYEQNQKLDIGKVTQFAAIHDLLEAFMDEGDISVYAPAQLLQSKKKSEKIALKRLENSVRHQWITETIRDYERQTTIEARFVYALDKMVVHMNVILNDKHHAQPTLAQYLQTEAVARDKISRSYPTLMPYFDELCQIFKESPHFFRKDPN